VVTTKRPRRRRPSLTADTDDPVREAALRLLARREHAVGEVKDKLARRGYDSEAIETVVADLQAEGLVSEDRFVEQFVGERVRKGQGPVKIQAELGQRGIDPGRAEAALAAYADEWLERAREACRRRFGETAPTSWSERARRTRYLQQRGFPPEVAQRVTAFSDTGPGESV